MKTHFRAKTVGVILIIIGVMLIVYTGFAFVVNGGILDLGVIKINTEVDHSIQYLPLTGVIMLVGGFMKIIPGKAA